MAFLLLAAASASCATLPAPSYPASTAARFALYARTNVCCDDPSAFAFEPLPGQGIARVIVGRTSPVFEFHSGPSPFAAFELPRATTPYRLRVQSLFDPDGGDETGVFYPVVALLDDTFIVVRMTSLDHLRLEPALATVGGESGLAVTVPIDPEVETGRYAVVFTPAALLGAAPGGHREGDLLTPATLAWIERRGPAMVPASPYGRLRITVAPETPAAPATQAAQARGAT